MHIKLKFTKRFTLSAGSFIYPFSKCGRWTWSMTATWTDNRREATWLMEARGKAAPIFAALKGKLFREQLALVKAADAADPDIRTTGAMTEWLIEHKNEINAWHREETEKSRARVTGDDKE